MRQTNNEPMAAIFDADGFCVSPTLRAADAEGWLYDMIAETWGDDVRVRGAGDLGWYEIVDEDGERLAEYQIASVTGDVSDIGGEQRSHDRRDDMTTTYDIDITDAQIRDLREGADQAHDREQVAICEIALGWYGYADGDEAMVTADGRRIIDMTRDEARAECARVLAASF